VPLRTLLVLVVAAIVVLAVATELQRPQSPAPGRASPVLTPGALNPDVTQATIGSTICVAGWTRTIRPPSSYTSTLKVRQLREYGFAGSPSDFEEDHLVSLELGGDPVDPRNLWPEPQPRARTVDTIENDLRERVCAGTMSLGAAQRKIAKIKHERG